jgi:hypothetical protein
VVDLRVAARAGVPGVFAMLVAATGLDIARELPAALVTISRAPSFVGTCDAAEVIELAHRLGVSADCTPGQFAPRGVFLTTPTDGGIRLAVYDSDGVHVIAPWIDVAWRTQSRWWPSLQFRVIDLDGDGVDEIVMTEPTLSADGPLSPANDVRVFAVERGQLVLVGEHDVEGDDVVAIEAARHIYDQRARE